jgi:YegS/Rv2252/BmrU family lipid kinase
LATAIIINPVSGGGAAGCVERMRQATDALSRTRIQAEVFVSERRGHARELAAGAVGRGADLVIAWGGDGTVHEVASALVGTPAALGIVPSGSGNGLARTLGVARRPAVAIAEAVGGTRRPIDAGVCNGEMFFSVAGVGFDAHVAAVFDRSRGGRRGLSTYVRVSMRELLTYEARHYTIDGVRTSRPALLLTAANSAQFGNGARIAPEARLDDGLLDLVTVEESSRLASVCAVPRLFTGGIARVKGVSIRRVRSVAIAGGPPLVYHLDGEPRRGDGLLDIAVRPGALMVSVR